MPTPVDKKPMDKNPEKKPLGKKSLKNTSEIDKAKSEEISWIPIIIAVLMGTCLAVFILNYNEEMDSTGWGSHFRTPVSFNILKKPLLVLQQTIPQQKVLDLSLKLAWHYHEASKPSCPKICFSRQVSVVPS